MEWIFADMGASVNVLFYYLINTIYQVGKNNSGYCSGLWIKEVTKGQLGKCYVKIFCKINVFYNRESRKIIDQNRSKIIITESVSISRKQTLTEKLGTVQIKLTRIIEPTSNTSFFLPRCCHHVSVMNWWERFITALLVFSREPGLDNYCVVVAHTHVLCSTLL